METTRLSSKGQVIIPKAIRDSHHWENGLEFQVIDTGDGILLKPKTPFAETNLADVAGMLRGKVVPRSDTEIEEVMNKDIRSAWRDDD